MVETAGLAGKSRKLRHKELLETKNAVWLCEGESTLSAQAFSSRMELLSIHISFDGEGVFAFWYSDGDMFRGHSIKISGNLEDGPSRVDLVG